jgi:hypothetical protein
MGDSTLTIYDSLVRGEEYSIKTSALTSVKQSGVVEWKGKQQLRGEVDVKDPEL